VFYESKVFQAAFVGIPTRENITEGIVAMHKIPVIPIVHRYSKILPRWIDEEDLNQELLLEMWRSPEIAQSSLRQRFVLIDVLRRVGYPRSVHSEKAYSVRFPLSLEGMEEKFYYDERPRFEARSLLAALLPQLGEGERKVLTCLYNQEPLRATGHSDPWNSCCKARMKQKLLNIMEK
jgi:hypothetical protein